MNDFGFPYVLHPGSNEGGLSPAHAQLWKTATEFVSRVPTDWPVRCHELSRALLEVLSQETPLQLHLQDGALGPQYHSWFWVGGRPNPARCAFDCGSANVCDWEGVYYDPKTFKTYCTMHSNAVFGSARKRYPYIRSGAVILDSYFSGALPPVVMFPIHRGLATSRGLYRPGPPRDDIDATMVLRLKQLFRHANPNIAIHR